MVSLSSSGGGGIGDGGDKQASSSSALSQAADALLSSYGQMLSLAQRGAVTMAVAEKKLGSLLDFLATTLGGGGGGGSGSGGGGEAREDGSHSSPGERVLERVYVATLESLSASASSSASSSACAPTKAGERLAFRTRLRLASLWLDQRAHARAAKLLDELLVETSASASGQQQQQEQSPSAAATPGANLNLNLNIATDARAGTALLDVLALQIRLRTERGDAARSLRPLHRN